jgi:ABC-type multidrug transport system fused ATPase/permease subunit
VRPWDNSGVKVREAIRESLSLLTARDRRLLWVAIAIQMSTSFLDLIGVLFLGLVAALAVTTVQSQPAPAIVTSVADALGLGGLSDQALVAVLAGLAAIVLLSKSVFSSLLTRRVFIFLANRQALVSARLARELLSRPLLFLQSRSSQETAYALIQGAGSATISILGQLVIVATEAALLVVLGVALLFIDPLVTVGVVIFFALVALVLQRIMGSWASRLGREGAEADIASLNTIQDALLTYREITVLNRREAYINRFQDLRWRSASVNADRTFILQAPKYVFEAAMVVGGVALAGTLFLTKDSVAAVATLALYLVAASRVMPSLLRLQGAALTLRDNAAAAAPTFALAEELGRPTADAVVDANWHDELIPRGGQRQTQPIAISVDSVSLTYPGATRPAVVDVTIDVPPGSSIALVGRSGAGKSTLVDLLLGVIEPDSGSITLNGASPRDAVSAHPGSIGYVPQAVSLVNGTLRENVALGLPEGLVADERVWQALQRAHLDEPFMRDREGLDTRVGENGVKLSGGQRQRLGIARALLLNPSLVVLDEATSALDAETESNITEVIDALHGSVTTVIVAHRLSTVRNADVVAYMENGKITDSGTFEDLRRRVPSLARQAELMGL